jgi:hypothetical protein
VTCCGLNSKLIWKNPHQFLNHRFHIERRVRWMPGVWICAVVKTELEVSSPYAVAKHDDVEGSITFSLSEEVWKEKQFPQVGERVTLDELRRGPKGWRAKAARFTTPQDEAGVGDEQANKQNRKNRNIRTGGKNVSKSRY